MTERARILVVDDDADLLRLTSMLLQQAGHEILEATTGGDGLRLAREEEPDLVLLDVMLPDMDGLEMCRRIKADAHQGGSFVVFLSAFQTGPDDNADGLEAGADGYITRPITNRELLARVQAMLRFKQAEDALRERTHQLGERVKELNCLYGISQLVGTPGISLDEILQGTVDLIPPSWQYPEITCARIILEDQEFKTDNFQETPWRQTQDIKVRGNPAGGVEVIYLEERPTIDERPFLKEERSLINAIAAQLGRIVERMRAEEALRKNEKRYRQLLEALQEGIWVIDQDAYTTLVNPRMAEMLGYSVEEMQGEHLFAFMDERGVEISKRNLERREQGITEQHDFEFMRKDGSRMYALLETSPIYDDDGIYIGGIAGIQALFSASLIADTVPRVWERDPEEGRRGLEEIHRLTHGALAEMRNLLFELRPDALSEQNLGVLLRQLTVGMMARTRTSFTTKVEGDHSLPGEVRVALYRIAQETLNNITKHARASKATVSLHNEPDRVTLHICDDGRGFDPEDVQPERLGLRIMRERAQAIGATFSIKSQPAQGTEVTVVWSDGETD